MGKGEGQQFSKSRDKARGKVRNIATTVRLKNDEIVKLLIK
jgi:hypothetical protein